MHRVFMLGLASIIIGCGSKNSENESTEKSGDSGINIAIVVLVVRMEVV